MGVPLDPNLKRCEIHNETFGKLEQCSKCRASRGISVKTASPKADTRELQLREDEYRSAEKYLRRKGEEWLEGTERERNLGLKCFDTATKYARLAMEIRQARLEMEHDMWLRDQKALLGGGGN